MSQSQLVDAIKRSQEVAGFYQAQDEKKAEALRLLKGQLIRQHQAELYRSNEGKFATLRRQVYEHFRDAVFPDWDPSRTPHGVYYQDAFALAHMETWGVHMNESTYRRRWNELADKRITNPPLLEWKVPGYYVLAKILEGQR